MWLNATAVKERRHDVYQELLSIRVATIFLQRYYKLTSICLKPLRYHPKLYLAL